MDHYRPSVRRTPRRRPFCMLTALLLYLIFARVHGNGYTGMAQNHVSVRTCGFESRLRRSQIILYVLIIPLIKGDREPSPVSPPLLYNSLSEF